MPPESISQTICDVIRHWAERNPNKPAFVAEGQAPLTYGALTQLMDDFRETLNASGFGRGDRIAIVHPGGAEMAATIIGVEGCTTAVPLNPAYTVGEFAIYLHDRGVNALIVEACMDTPARDAAERQGIPVLEVELVENSVAGKVALRPGPEQMARQPGPATSDDLALVLATSGTTSHSKIVPRHHRHLNVRAAIHKKIYGLRDDDRLLNLQPLFYGSGLSHFAGALFSGGSVIFMPRFDVETFFR